MDSYDEYRIQSMKRSIETNAYWKCKSLYRGLYGMFGDFYKREKAYKLELKRYLKRMKNGEVS